MRVLLVWPNKDNFGFKPIGLSLLSAVLKRRGHEVRLLDTTFVDFGCESDNSFQSRIRVFKPVDYGDVDVTKKRVDPAVETVRVLDDFRPDLVGISALSDEVEVGLEISRTVKAWDETTPVVWGNKAATMAAEKILADTSVDFVCVGEGIELIVELAECLEHKGDAGRLHNLAHRDEKGRVVCNPLRPFYQDLDSLPLLDWSIFDRRQFLKPFDGQVYVGGDHMIGWGCPNDCTYCINHAYRQLYGPAAGRFLRWYTVDRIIEELRYLVDTWGVTFFKFYDEDFCLRPTPYFRELSEKYRAFVNVPFTAMSNGHTLTAERVRLLKEMNCTSISIGIETGNDRMRRQILKRTESRQEIVRAIHLLNDAGIRTSAFNMLGVPLEDRSTIMETIELNRESQVRYPNTGFFYPLEGTELRDESVRLGFFDEATEAVFDNSRPALNLPGISAEQLMALRERFVLYVKMPRPYHTFIERSEQPDETGRALTRKLYEIYDTCVFQHDGLWDDGGRADEYIGQLKEILSFEFCQH